MNSSETTKISRSGLLWLDRITLDVFLHVISFLDAVSILQMTSAMLFQSRPNAARSEQDTDARLPIVLQSLQRTLPL